jgi:hypothetical protein
MISRTRILYSKISRVSSSRYAPKLAEHASLSQRTSYKFSAINFSGSSENDSKIPSFLKQSDFLVFLA